MSVKENIVAWRAFLSVADSGSIKQAAIELDQDMSQISRLIAGLEDEFGFPLFNRKTRPLALTQKGDMLRKHARHYVAVFDDLIAKASDLADACVRYRLCFPVNVGRDALIDQLVDYKAIDPTIEFELVSECDHEDILSHRVDLALLPYQPPAKGLLIWDIGEGFNVPVASPEYIEKYGYPEGPEDLARHTVILRTGRNYPSYDELYCEGKKAPFKPGKVGLTGDALSCRSAATAGLGIAMDVSFDLIKRELFNGDLIPVLGGWHRKPWRMSLVMSRENSDKPRLMHFAEWFAAREKKDNEARWKSMFIRFGHPHKPEGS
jgi:DNA-binding transcriptional LysR family regulator